jgi:hypothetical protein
MDHLMIDAEKGRRESEYLSIYRDYIRGSLRQIRYLTQRHDGDPEGSYRLLAVQPRMLLCDRKREHGDYTDISLLPKMIPVPHFISINNPPDSLPLPEWLAQTVTLTDGSSHSIREMIKLICERDGGAHVDLSGMPLQDAVSILRRYHEMGEVLIRLAGPLADEIDEMLFSD